MKQFSELGIEAAAPRFEGDKISTESVINRKIKVIAFEIRNSKYADKGNGKCLYIQVETNGEKRVLFTGSGNLMDTIVRVNEDDFPFYATIVKNNKRLEFT